MLWPSRARRTARWRTRRRRAPHARARRGARGSVCAGARRQGRGGGARHRRRRTRRAPPARIQARGGRGRRSTRRARTPRSARRRLVARDVYSRGAARAACARWAREAREGAATERADDAARAAPRARAAAVAAGTRAYLEMRLDARSASVRAAGPAGGRHLEDAPREKPEERSFAFNDRVRRSSGCGRRSNTKTSKALGMLCARSVSALDAMALPSRTRVPRRGGAAGVPWTLETRDGVSRSEGSRARRARRRGAARRDVPHGAAASEAARGRRRRSPRRRRIVRARLDRAPDALANDTPRARREIARDVRPVVVRVRGPPSNARARSVARRDARKPRRWRSRARRERREEGRKRSRRWARPRATAREAEPTCFRRGADALHIMRVLTTSRGVVAPARARATRSPW